jgi:hypothetical protein
MLYDGMLVPEEQGDGSFAWVSPAGTSDLPHYNVRCMH